MMIKKNSYDRIEKDLEDFKRVLDSLKKNREQIASTMDENESKIEGVLNDLVEDVKDQLTELREDKRKVIENMKFTESIIENSPGMLAVIDKEDKWIKVNSAWTSTWGWSPKKLLGNRTIEQPFILPERAKDVEEENKLILEKIPSGEILKSQRELLAKDGSKRVALVMEKALRHQEEILGRVMIIMDITEFRKREEELEAARKFNQSLIENLPAAIWMSDEVGRCCLINDEFTRLLGWEKDELIGKRAFDSPFVCRSGLPYMGVGYTDAIRKLWDAIAEKRSVAAGEVPYGTKDGQIRILKTIEIPYGKGMSRLDVSIDVTELRERELEIKRNLVLLRDGIDRVAQEGELSARVDMDSLGDDYKRMGENANRIFDVLESKVKELGGAQSIIENIPVGIVTYKADDPERKWSRINSTMERITGYGISEMLGKKIESQPFNTDKATKIIEEQREKYDEMPAFEIPWITKGGFHIVVRINVGTIKDESGKVTEYIFVIEDVTQ